MQHIAHGIRPSLSTLALLALITPLSILGCNKSSPPAAATPAAAAPSATPAASSDAPPGYAVEVSTDTGKSLVTKKPNVTTVTAALLATFPDLQTYFGNQPNIGSAYQAAHDPSTGGATFGATYQGQPVRGIVSCKLHDGGASISVIFGHTNAPKADWEKLMATPTAGQTSPAQTAAQPPVPGTPPDSSKFAASLTDYSYADGTGSVGIADGWKTQSQSTLDPTAIVGPADQIVILHNSLNVSPTNSPAVLQRQKLLDMQAQNQANYARNGYNLPPPKPLPPLMVADFTDPVTAVKDMIPQFSKRSEFNHGPSFTLDQINSSQDLPCALPNGKRGLINYTITRTLGGQSTHYRAQLLLVMLPFQPQGQSQPVAWMWFARYSLQAPEATFDHDLPLMMAMVNSEKVDQNRATQVAQARNQQAQQMGQEMLAAQQAQYQAINNMFRQNAETQFKIHEQQQQQTQAGYDAHNQQFRDDQLQRSRNSADFDESIIGTRTIYDTVTGQSGYANLTDVNGVVDSLNQAALDPNRFVQIPLRDQLYPVPQQK